MSGSGIDQTPPPRAPRPQPHPLFKTNSSATLTSCHPLTTQSHHERTSCNSQVLYTGPNTMAREVQPSTEPPPPKTRAVEPPSPRGGGEQSLQPSPASLGTWSLTRRTLTPLQGSTLEDKAFSYFYI